MVADMQLFLDVLRGRKGRPITAHDAAVIVYGKAGATQRRAIGHMVEELVYTGELICSSYGAPAGYYIPEDPRDSCIDADILSLIRRARKTLVQAYTRKRIVDRLRGGSGQVNWIDEAEAVYGSVKEELGEA